jgi:hypothetical protein
MAKLDRVCKLEEGYVGGYTFEAYPARREGAWRSFGSWLICGIFTLVIFATVGFMIFRGARQTVRGVSVDLNSDSLCVATRTSWANVLSFPGTGVSMTYVKIMSGSRDTVYAAETLDLEACVGKKIYRSRDFSVTIRYVDATEWPTGEYRYERYEDTLAVCVQHALDVFSGRVNCNSN